MRIKQIKHYLFTAVAVTLLSATAYGQESFPGCTIAFDLTATGTSGNIDLRYKNCGTIVDVIYNTTPSISALSLALEGAPDAGAGPGTFVTVTATYPIGANPSTTLVNGRMRAVFAAGVPAFIRVNATITGTGNLRGSLTAVNTPVTYSASGGGAAASDINNGQIATGASIGVQRPITVSGTDAGGIVRNLFLDANGTANVQGPTLTTATVLPAAQFPVLLGGMDLNVLRSVNVDSGGRLYAVGASAPGTTLSGNPMVAAGVTSGGNLVRSLIATDQGYLNQIPINLTGGGAGTPEIMPVCNQSAYADVTATGQVQLTVGQALQRTGVCAVVFSQGATSGWLRLTAHSSGNCANTPSTNVFTGKIFVPAGQTVTIANPTRLINSNVSDGICVESSTPESSATISYYTRQ